MKEVTPYLNFDGTCADAMAFYGKTLGLDLHTMPFAEGQCPKGAEGRIMHANLTKNGVSILMASDTIPDHPFIAGNNMYVAVQCESLEEIKRFYRALAEGGKETMPPADMFWGAHFGMCIDRFGIQWMFNYPYPPKA